MTAVLLAASVAAITTVALPGTARARASATAASGPICPGQSAHNTAVSASDFTKVNGVVPRPVVLVHGWDSSYMSMQGYATLLDTSKVLHAPLHAFLFDYSADSGHWAAIPAIASCLALYVNQVSGAYMAAGGDGKVFAVGHSMGGLAIRFSSDAQYAAQPDGANLGGVVTIDTPHLGSPWGATPQAQLAQDVVQNTTGNFLKGMIPWPPGGDGQLCLAPHIGSSGMPPGCATPSWLPASVPVAEIGGDITVHRQLLGFDIATTDTGGDAVVQTSSSLGYQPASGPGAPPGPVQPPATYVDSCDLTTGQLEAGLAGYGISIAHGVETLILSLGTPAGNGIWNSPLTEPVATLLSLANISAPCSHTNIENPAADPFASLDVLKALNADLDRLTATQTVALPASSWTPVGGAVITSHSNGTFEVAYGPTYWGGIIATTNAGCSYRFSGQGQVIGGGGYGLTAWASVDSTGAPHGQAIQYDLGIGGYRDTSLPSASETGPVQQAAVDNGWHTVSIQVVNGKYTSMVDGVTIFSGTMTGSCTNQVFIRLWNSDDVEFRELTITSLK